MTLNLTKIFVALFALSLLLPLAASAHEIREYEIKGAKYEFVVGSRGEPVIVDDKTGVDLELVRNGELVIGAQDSLQVEMIAGNTKKLVNLEPVWGADGKYKTNFIATVPTTLEYRIFGTLEGAAFDVTFTCAAAGHTEAEENTTRTTIGVDVFQTLKKGAFGCPQPKEAFGFPEEAPSSLALVKDIDAATAKSAVNPVASQTSNTNAMVTYVSIATLILAAAAFLLGVRNCTRRKDGQ